MTKHLEAAALDDLRCLVQAFPAHALHFGSHNQVGQLEVVSRQVPAHGVNGLHYNLKKIERFTEVLDIRRSVNSHDHTATHVPGHVHRHITRDSTVQYEWIELSPRADFLEWFKAPRVFPDRVRSLRKALSDANVGIATLLPMYRWASNDEEERMVAVRHWKRAIEIAVVLQGVDTMNSEFGRGPHPDKGTCYCCHTGSMIEACEDAWWRSMEELVPIFEKEGIEPPH